MKTKGQQQKIKEKPKNTLGKHWENRRKSQEIIETLQKTKGKQKKSEESQRETIEHHRFSMKS